MNVLHKNERITHIRKDGSPSPWSIIFTVDRVNKEISHSLLPSRPTRLFMFLRNWNLLCLWVGQCYCQGFIGLFFKSFGRRVVVVFFSKKSLLQLPAGGIPTCWKCEGMVARRFLGDEVLSYLHNMLLPETVGSNRDPLLAMSWFWWWLLAEEHPKSNLQLLFVTNFGRCSVRSMLCARNRPVPSQCRQRDECRREGKIYENFRTVVEQQLNNWNGQLQMVHL